MKAFFSLSFSLLFLWGCAQKMMTSYYSAEALFQQRSFDQPFSSSLGSLDNIRFLEKPVYAGLQLTGKFHFPSGRRSVVYFSGASSYMIMIPARIRVFDSLRATLTGFKLGMPVYGVDLLARSTNADIIVSAGFNAGCTWIFGSRQLQSRNAFFSPKLSLMPRFAIGELVVSFVAEYDYDVSNPRWKKTLFGPKHFRRADPFRQGGLTLGFSIGRKLN